MLVGDVLVRNTLPFSTCRTTKPDQSREARDGWHGQEAATAHRLGRRALPFGSAASGSTRRDAARAAARQRPADPTIARPIPESNKHLPGRVLHGAAEAKWWLLPTTTPGRVSRRHASECRSIMRCNSWAWPEGLCKLSKQKSATRKTAAVE